MTSRRRLEFARIFLTAFILDTMGSMGNHFVSVLEKLRSKNANTSNTCSTKPVAMMMFSILNAVSHVCYTCAILEHQLSFTTKKTYRFWGFVGKQCLS